MLTVNMNKNTYQILIKGDTFEFFCEVYAYIILSIIIDAEIFTVRLNFTRFTSEFTERNDCGKKSESGVFATSL